MGDKFFHGINIKFSVKLEKNATDIYKMLTANSWRGNSE
jgi:hypothetical protein